VSAAERPGWQAAMVILAVLVVALPVLLLLAITLGY
jgi:hypothetical protein